MNIKDYLNLETRSSIDDNISALTVLKFKDETTFQKTLNKLQISVEEKRKWDKNSDNFSSIQDVFNQAMIDVDLVDETEESYMNFKSKYDKYLYFPMYKEDYGVYIPFIEKEKAHIANPDGYVIVGNEVRNLKSIYSYSDLQMSGQAYYDGMSDLRSLNRIWNTHSQFIGDEMDSGWREIDGRKLKIKFGRLSNKMNINPLPNGTPGGKFAMNLKMEISFRKKTWIGWVNYSSKTNTDITYQFLGKTYTKNYSSDGYSSHDWKDGNKFPWSTTNERQPNGRPIFITPEVRASFETGFRGFKNKYKWSCILPESKFVEY